MWHEADTYDNRASFLHKGTKMLQSQGPLFSLEVVARKISTCLSVTHIAQVHCFLWIEWHMVHCSVVMFKTLSLKYYDRMCLCVCFKGDLYLLKRELWPTSKNIMKTIRKSGLKSCCCYLQLALGHLEY